MRKLARLIGVVFVLLSLFYATSFVNECRQMRDVFNSFVVIENLSSGKQCSIVNDTLRRSYESLHFFDAPRPLWVDTGGHFVYSAFWSSNVEKYAVALAIGPSSEPHYECHVWFEYENIVTSVKGRFSSLSLPFDSSINIFRFFCTIKENDIKGTPYFLILTTSKNARSIKSHVPIFHKTVSKSSNRTTLCVRPDTVGIGKADVVEFISFHLLVGATDVVLYGNEIHNSIIHRVRQLVGASNFLKSLSLLSWNFPYDDPALELKLIQMDCEYRTFGLSKAFAVLEWDQYIVPNTFKPLLEIINLDNNKLPYLINVRTQICCLESTDDKRSEISWPIILKKTYCTIYPFDSFIKVHGDDRKNHDNVIVKDYNASISLKTYRSCVALKNLKTKYDHSPFNFLSGLLSSELLRLWNTGSMF